MGREKHTHIDRNILSDITDRQLIFHIVVLPWKQWSRFLLNKYQDPSQMENNNVCIISF